MDTTSLKSEFDAFDTDGNGVISKDEFMAVRLFKILRHTFPVSKNSLFLFSDDGKTVLKGVSRLHMSKF